MFSIDSEAIDQLRRVLDARAYAARTQLNTATFEVALARLEDALDQAETYSLDGRPQGVDINVWNQFEISLARANRDRETLEAQARGQEPEDDWSTFGVTPGSPDVGTVQPTTYFTPREPTTSGEPDTVGTKTVGSALPYQPNKAPQAPQAPRSPQAPTSGPITIDTGTIDQYRQNQGQQAQSSFPVMPVVAGVAAFGIVAAILFMGRK